MLSFGTAGCNLACRFCQNWDISKSRQMDTLADDASPETIARAAAELGCRSVAYTYNDPVIFLEYAVDVAAACRVAGVANVAVTAAEILAEPRTEFFAEMDAANVDLKAFTEEFYRTQCGGELEPVKETLEYLARETEVWVELTTLLIPGLNDSDRELDEMTDVGGREARPRRAHAFHRFSPRLQDARSCRPRRLRPSPGRGRSPWETASDSPTPAMSTTSRGAARSAPGAARSSSAATGTGSHGGTSPTMVAAPPAKPPAPVASTARPATGAPNEYRFGSATSGRVQGAEPSHAATTKTQRLEDAHEASQCLHREAQMTDRTSHHRTSQVFGDVNTAWTAASSLGPQTQDSQIAIPKRARGFRFHGSTAFGRPFNLPVLGYRISPVIDLRQGA